MARPHSESFAWQEVERLARQALRAFALRDSEGGRVKLSAIRQVASGMMDQVTRGIHANPALLVFGNPRKKQGTRMSGNVLAVLYVHDDDGEQYAHGFGDAVLDLHTQRDGTVTIGGLSDATDVEMIAQDDGSVVLRGTHGQQLWSDV